VGATYLFLGDLCSHTGRHSHHEGPLRLLVLGLTSGKKAPEEPVEVDEGQGRHPTMLDLDVPVVTANLSPTINI
jgi:hypothetical protein